MAVKKVVLTIEVTCDEDLGESKIERALNQAINPVREAPLLFFGQQVEIGKVFWTEASIHRDK